MVQEGKPQLRMQVDVGSGVMMQAEAHSPLKLLVDVGLGFHAECNIAEAQQIASLQEVAAQVSRCHGPALDRSQSIRPCYMSSHPLFLYG